jgi:PAS domain S-box-containing protein
MAENAVPQSSPGGEEQHVSPVDLRRWRLHRKLLAFLIVGLVAPPLLVTWFGLQRERSLVRAANVAVLQARVDEVGHTLEAMYGGYQTAASQAARDPAIIAFCAGSPGMRRSGLPLIGERLDVFRGAAPAIRGLSVLDTSGTVIAATEGPLLGRNLSNRPEIQTSLAGAEAVSDVFISREETGHVPSVAFLAPVRTSAGVIVGVYLISVRAEALWQVMRAANDTAGRGSFFAIFDQYGIRVGHSKNPKLLFHPSVPLSEEAKRAMLASRRFQDRTAELITAVIPFPFQLIQGEERKVFWRPTSPTNNVPNLAASRRFPALRGTIVAHVPQSEVEVTVLSVLPRVLPGFAVGLALAIAGGVLLIRLRQSKDVLEKTFEYMDQGISIADDNLNVIAVNRRFGELLRFPEELCKPGTSFEELVRYNARRGDYGPGPVEEQVRAQVEEALHFQTHHVERERPDGTILDIRGYRVPGTGVVSIYTDVTERARAERAVRESEARFRSLTELSSDWYWEQDTNLHFITLSNAAQAKSGYTAGNSLGKALWELPDTTPASGSWDELKALMAARKTFRDFECRHTGAHGATQHLSFSGMPILVEDGGFRGYRGTGRDITEKKRSDELARALAASEEDKRLKMQRAEAENHRLLEASRLKSEFLANMSHELRTPLNAILGFTEIVHSREVGPLSAKQDEFLTHVLSGGRHLLRLINDVLDLVKLESGKLIFHPEPIEIPDIVREVISSLEPAAKSGRIQVRMEVDEAVGPMLADATRLKQVLYNYLSNALKFTPPGGSVVVRSRLEGAGAFVLEVEDSGVGIRPEDLRRLFVEFQQLDAGYTKKYGGTGLGLAFTRRLVEAQGGSVGVRSTPGQGSVFHALLPRRVVAAQGPEELSV